MPYLDLLIGLGIWLLLVFVAPIPTLITTFSFVTIYALFTWVDRSLR